MVEVLKHVILIVPIRFGIKSIEDFIRLSDMESLNNKKPTLKIQVYTKLVNNNTNKWWYSICTRLNKRFGVKQW